MGQIELIWTCDCGKSTKNDGLLDAVRFLTNPKICYHCGHTMHFKAVEA